MPGDKAVSNINKEMTEDNNAENILHVCFEDDECLEDLQEDEFDDIERGTTIYFICSATDQIERILYLE